MLQLVSSLLAAAALSAVGAPPAPVPAQAVGAPPAQGPVQAGPQTEGDAVKVMQSRISLSLNCGGRDLIVGGDDDRLQVADCRAIEVAGSRNHMRAKLMAESYISASGDRNIIIYIPVPGIEALARSTGRGNEINSPPMSVDARNNVPFPAPKMAHPPG